MSRVGLKPIKIPEAVKIKVEKDLVTVEGPLGTLTQKTRPEIKIEKEDDSLKFTRVNNSRQARSLHGLTRSLVANMITGVTQGFKKELEIQGTGYRAKLEGGNLILSLGFSHPVKVEPVTGIKFEVDQERQITILGNDKALVGNVAARIRKIRPPDAYKGKGIRYLGEQIKLKPGKAGAAGATA